jgi:Secretion system C-terminal sorting domain
MKKIIITLAAMAYGIANAIAQCATTPNNFEIQLHQNKQTQTLEVQIRYAGNTDLHQLPNQTMLLDGLVFAIANPINSDAHISAIEQSKLGFDLQIDHQLGQYKTANVLETITTIYHNNTATAPVPFTTNWKENQWMTIAKITYTGTIKEGSFFSLVNCDYGMAHPNSYQGNSTTDPWLSLYNITTQSFEQYSPKMITALPTNANATTQLQIFPNPANDVINVSFGASTATAVAAKIIDATGKIVKIINTEVITGENKISFSIAELPIGVYQLMITDGKTLQLTGKVEKND